jgi:hypothetical protein
MLVALLALAATSPGAGAASATKPGQVLSVAELGRQFVPRRSGPQAAQWLAGFGGMYVIVAPYRVSLRPAARTWHVTPI